MIVLLMYAVGAATGQDQSSAELDAERLRYDVERAKMIKPIRDLEGSYESQLKALREQVKASGSLEKTKAVDAEIKGFRDGSAPVAPNDFPDLRRLKRIYVTELNKRHGAALRALPALVAAHKAELEKLQKTLTQRDQLEQAESVKQALGKVDDTLGITVPKLVTAGSAGGRFAVVQVQGDTMPFQEGQKQVTNRDFVWRKIPDEYQDWVMTMNAGGSVSDSEIEVKNPGLVYVVIGPRFEQEFRNNGWKKIEKIYGGPGGKQDYLVLSKPFEQGTHRISGRGWFNTRILLPPSSQEK